MILKGSVIGLDFFISGFGSGNFILKQKFSSPDTWVRLWESKSVLLLLVSELLFSISSK